MKQMDQGRMALGQGSVVGLLIVSMGRLVSPTPLAGATPSGCMRAAQSQVTERDRGPTRARPGQAPTSEGNVTIMRLAS